MQHDNKERPLGEPYSVVVDIGKTVSKITLFSSSGDILDRTVRPNPVASSASIRRLDVAGIEAWLMAGLKRFAGQPIKYLIPVGHGAGVAALVDGKLAFPPLDYEQSIPSSIVQAYRRERDPFDVTGSPALPDGLNLGCQLFWLERLHPEEMAEATLIPWAQYWTWFLSGTMVSERTSLGCHSDLWAPADNDFAPMAKRLGWSQKFAPLAFAGDEVGLIRPEIAAATGISPEIRVLAGIHDSNAALLGVRACEEITGRDTTVLSTGTWFIAMRLTEQNVPAGALDGSRDCLVNVEAFGRQVPSARFMGGREIEQIVRDDVNRIDIAADQPTLLQAATEVVAAGTMLLPAVVAACGPFANSQSGWINEPHDVAHRRAAAALYAALMSATSLSLIGSREFLLVEGRFAGSEVFVRALAALLPDIRVFTAGTENDVSFGALRLVDSHLRPRAPLRRVMPLDADLGIYQNCWLGLIDQRARGQTS